MSAPDSRSPAEGAVNSSSLACLTCKRRKVKCDRTLPICQVCSRTFQSCTYPIAPNKPGPKPGSTQRSHKRRQFSSPGSTPAKLKKEASSSQTNSPWPMTGSVASPDRSVDSIKGEMSQLPTRSPLPANDRGTLSYILHPSHERASPPRVPDPPQAVRPNDPWVTYNFWQSNLCQLLNISMQTYQMLLQSFHDKFKAFSLFHRPSFETKLANLQTQKHYEALICAVLSIAVRFEGRATNVQMAFPSPEFLLDRASKLLQSCLDEYVDSPPPLAILQGMLLTLFQHLTKGVRGKAWRDLGVCMRIAYELELHLIDTNERKAAVNLNTQMDEERRRTWWVIWEFDVFASCIRRLPTAIDWACNMTLLPIPDETWFAGETCKSCFLEPDLRHRWKALQRSGNQSATAWFIVINSLMRNAQLLYNFPGSKNSIGFKTNSERRDSAAGASGFQEEDKWGIIHNSLSSIMIAMPSHLSYKEEYLSFGLTSTGTYSNSLEADTAKYSIHLMTHLVRFMLYHHRCFSIPTSTEEKNGAMDHASPQSARSQSKEFPIDRQAWEHYHDAANQIVNVVRNSGPDHILHVNPFLANTIWFAAAAQVVFRLFSFPSANHTMAESNFDLLRSSFNAFASFWGVSKELEHNLDTLETRLQKMSQGGNQAPTSASLYRGEIYQTAPPVAQMGQEIVYPDGGIVPNLAPDLFNENFYYEWDLSQLLNYSGM